MDGLHNNVRKAISIPDNSPSIRDQGAALRLVCVRGRIFCQPILEISTRFPAYHQCSWLMNRLASDAASWAEGMAWAVLFILRIALYKFWENCSHKVSLIFNLFLYSFSQCKWEYRGMRYFFYDCLNSFTVNSVSSPCPGEISERCVHLKTFNLGVIISQYIYGIFVVNNEYTL